MVDEHMSAQRTDTSWPSVMFSESRRTIEAASKTLCIAHSPCDRCITDIPGRFNSRYPIMQIRMRGTTLTGDMPCESPLEGCNNAGRVGAAESAQAIG